MQIRNLIILLSIIISVSSCYKDTLVQDVPFNEIPDYGWGQGDSVPIVSPFYFRGKIDSFLYTFQDSIQDYLNTASDSTYVACDTNADLHGQLTGFYHPSGRNILEIRILGCVSDTSDQAQKEGILYPGTYPYGSSRFLNPVPGVEITWIDKNGESWTSLPGTGAANQDSFQVLNIVSWTPDNVGNVVITGTVKAHLYNGTESIPIESGEFVMHYGIY